MKHIYSLILLFCAVVSAAQNFNVAPSLRKHVEYLCSNSLKGRAAGSEGERKAAEYIRRELSAAGAVMLTGQEGEDFTISDESGEIHSLNVVGIVEGYDEKLRGEYIVVGANFDAPGVHNLTIDGRPVEQVYSGAYANASGVAVLIELARMAAVNNYLFPRSLIFVAFGAGEKGFAGSWYFVNRAFEQIGSVKAMVDLDMLGHISSSGALNILSQIASAQLEHILSLTAAEPVVAVPEIAKMADVPSDYLPFHEKNIPFYHFSSGKSKEYHTSRDVPSVLSYEDMEIAGNYIFHFIKTLSSLEDDMPALNKDRSTVRATEDKVYNVSQCDRRPQYFHSDENHFVKAWVYKYLRYPETAVKEGVQGVVLVSFIVEKNGQVTDVRVERSVDSRLDDEAVRVVSVSPKWSAGQIAGAKVRARVTVPVEFRLRKSNQFGLDKKIY